jgi:hypothetical protein
MMTQNNNNNPTVTPVASQATTPAPQPANVQPVKGDAAQVETAEKK